MVSCNNFQEHREANAHLEQLEKIRKLKEGIAEWLWHFDGYATSFDSNSVKHKTFWLDKADSLLRSLPPWVKVDTGEPENIYHSDQCSDNLNPQANCFNEGVKAARAKLVSIGQFLGDGKQ